MFWNASKMDGYEITANDGLLGIVKDFLFDDRTWLVRWLVVDTVNLLSNRKVLLPTSALEHIDPAKRELSVALTTRQVKDSPDIDTDQAVSRQMETRLYDHYRARPYWGGISYMDGYEYAPSRIGGVCAEKSWTRKDDLKNGRQPSGDPHLRSMKAVTGYHIHARDGEIGHVEDFLITDADWTVHYIVVETKNWWPGKKVLILPRSVYEVSWADRLLNLNIDRHMVKDSPVYDDETIVDLAYEQAFSRYYGEEH